MTFFREAQRSGVGSTRTELSDVINKYRMISDALSGEQEVKKRKTTYLPYPRASEANTPDGQARYSAYLTRAVFYNMIKPTKEGLVGQLFLRPPRVELPPGLEAMADDMNGEGLGFEQMVRLAANHVLPYGRAGLLADFPKTEGAVTAGDVERGIRPLVKHYPPWAILNWRMEKRGNDTKLVMLVLMEMEETKQGDNEFEVELKEKYLVYRLTKQNTVTLQVYREEGETTEPVQTITGADGKPFDEIPFEFIGSENNDAEVDDPPLYPFAVLNLAHYRNSADYEESVFLVGQPTPVYSGLTEDWVDNYFKGGVPFGSRASVPLPVGADAKLMQADPNSLAYEAMRQKEDQMIAIGAKIIGPRSTVERKEKEIEIESAGQKSVLMTIRMNLQDAFIAVLQKASRFVSTNAVEAVVELNDNFDLTSMNPEEIRWQIELFKSRVIPFEAVHENLRRSGIVKGTPDETKAAILADQEFIKQVTPEPAEPNQPPNNTGTQNDD